MRLIGMMPTCRRGFAWVAVVAGCSSSEQGAATQTVGGDAASDASIRLEASPDGSDNETMMLDANVQPGEASTITTSDAASVERPMEGASIACRPDEYCTEGQICCVSDTPGNFPKFTPPTYGSEVLGCQLPDPPCPETGLERYTLTCDGPEDCPVGEVCCSDFEAWVWTGLVFYDVSASIMIQEIRGARCQQQCAEQRLCHSDDTCSSSERCAAPSELIEAEFERSRTFEPSINNYQPLPYLVCAQTSILDGADGTP